MNLVDQAVSSIIRPPRHKYDHNQLSSILVSEDDDEETYIRESITITLPRGYKVVCSLYHNQEIEQHTGGPCVVYLHGNSSSQLEGQFLVPNFCQFDVFVFCFDFVGCGCSEGDNISLGYFEKGDVEYILRFMKREYNMGPFALWGRSMGAATALMVNDPGVVGIVADSPFASLKDLCSTIAKANGLPSLFVPVFLWYLQKVIKSEANFRLDDVSPLDNVKTNPVPMLLGHAKFDEFIHIENSLKLYDAHGGEKKLLNILPGGHNDLRSASWIRCGVSFILDLFDIKVDVLVISECRSLQSQDAHYESFKNLINGLENPLTKEEEDRKKEELNLFSININESGGEIKISSNENFDSTEIESLPPTKRVECLNHMFGSLVNIPHQSFAESHQDGGACQIGEEDTNDSPLVPSTKRKKKRTKRSPNKITQNEEINECSKQISSPRKKRDSHRSNENLNSPSISNISEIEPHETCGEIPESPNTTKRKRRNHKKIPESPTSIKIVENYLKRV